MRTIKNILVTITLIFAVTFSAKAQVKTIKTDQSVVTWKGYKVTGSHKGTIDIKSGSLTFENDKLIGGEFVIDMATINNTDQTGEYKGKLEGHLKSDDFFGVVKFPTAKLVFTKVESNGKNAYKVIANMTIKGISKEVIIAISIYGNKATATLKIDRTKYGVRYGSASFFDNLKDKAIYDEFDLVVDLEF